MDKRISIPTHPISWKWILRMALRDASKSKSRLLLFMSSIVIGIAALVSINSGSINLQRDIDNKAKELLGADLRLFSRDSVLSLAVLDSIPHKLAREANFKSMAFFPKTGDSRLTGVKSLEGDFPFYGEIQTEPITAAATFRDGSAKALVDKALLLQFNLKPGDSVRIGRVTFKIEGALIRTPSAPLTDLLANPIVYIPMSYMNSTELIRPGSNVNYGHYYKFTEVPEDFDVDKWIESGEGNVKELWSIPKTSVKTQRDWVSGHFNYMIDYLNLMAFVALLLGSIGVASTVNIYTKEKTRFVAILRCLGVNSKETFLIYLTQISMLGLLGSILGAALGVFIQALLPTLFARFLPIEVSFSLSWSSIFIGIFTGVIFTVLFALSSLVKIRKISPLVTLRGLSHLTKRKVNKTQLLIYLVICLFVIGFAFIQIGNWQDSLIFTLFMILAFTLLLSSAKGSMWLIKRFFPSKWAYEWRQGMANLYRPNNQTTILISSLGLATALITVLFFIQALLLNKLEVQKTEDLPNLMVFDIQDYQLDDIQGLLKSRNLPIMESIPVATMRLKSINNLAFNSKEQDPFGLFSEWRATYRDSLVSTEKIVEGVLNVPEERPSWLKEVGDNTILVSMEVKSSYILKLELGDTLTWDLQGIPITTILGSRRLSSGDRVHGNFKLFFPTGVLEEAPQFHVLLTKVGNIEERADLQRAIVKDYSNVSVVSFDMLLESLNGIMEKISFVVRFMAALSILTSLMVLISSVILSRFQRVKESVLLRTIGASRRQIFKINSLEYFLLGNIASFIGILLGLLASLGLGHFYFDARFTPQLLPMLTIYFSITILTVLIGLMNSRSIVNKPPLEVLRNEIQ